MYRSIADIDKALAKLEKRNPSYAIKIGQKLPLELKNLNDDFLDDNANSVPPYRPGRTTLLT